MEKQVSTTNKQNNWRKLPAINVEDNDYNEENMTKDERNAVIVVAKPSYPFLNMQMFWDNDGNLAFE
eukprot:1847062-Ditylum_brightwellii.AAC.1